MSSKNYISGRNFEYTVMRNLRKKGYYCIRAYGSKGPYDIIAVPQQGKPLLIQAKRNGYVPPTERKRLSGNKWDGHILIAWSKNRKLKFKTLDGNEFTI